MSNIIMLVSGELVVHRLRALLYNPEVKSILVFPTSGKPEQTASTVNTLIKNNK